MRIASTLLLFIVVFSAHAAADEGDDTLNFYLAKSPLVVVGKLEATLGGIVHEIVVHHHVCKISVTDVLQGDTMLKGQTLNVNIVRFEDGEKDRHPLIRKDAECILFLKPTSNTPRWQTSDPWFGIQQASPLLAESLKRLSLEKQKAAPVK